MVRAVAVWIGVVVLLAFVAPEVRAQDRVEDVIQDIEDALERGDARTLLQHADSRVEVTILGMNTLYSRAQTLYVLEDFFREYPPERFTFRERSHAGNEWLATGHYWHRQDDSPLHVYVRLRERENRIELREIRIEPVSR